ncbi:MAG: hypothetical protein AB3N10_10095 [Allomuricauda sp.]
MESVHEEEICDIAASYNASIVYRFWFEQLDSDGKSCVVLAIKPHQKIGDVPGQYFEYDGKWTEVNVRTKHIYPSDIGGVSENEQSTNYADKGIRELLSLVGAYEIFSLPPEAIGKEPNGQPNGEIAKVADVYFERYYHGEYDSVYRTVCSDLETPFSILHKALVSYSESSF